MTWALIIIDVWESFRQQPAWAAISNPGICEQVSMLAEAARARRDLVVWVLHAEPGTGTVFDPASGHVRLIDGLAPRAARFATIRTVAGRSRADRPRDGGLRPPQRERAPRRARCCGIART